MHIPDPMRLFLAQHLHLRQGVEAGRLDLHLLVPDACQLAVLAVRLLSQLALFVLQTLVFMHQPLNLEGSLQA